jgi:ABC-type sugar transport system ATPase subunit
VNAHAGFTLGATAKASRGLDLCEVSKTFGSVTALFSVSISVRPGELLAITGPSGAGKTTLCRIVAGLERPDSGACRIGGHDVAATPPGSRRVAYMFESYALYPHMTVRQNVMSPLVAPNGKRGEARGVDDLLDLLEIRDLAGRLPAALSGGQKQRVALARTLVQSPAVTLLDEPISHLDAKLRHKLRHDIRRLVTARSSPTLWCTPDAMEALSVGDRVAVIDSGTIEQIGTPEELWLKPASVRVARLLGDPPMNLLPGRVECHGQENANFVSANLSVRLSARLVTAAMLLGHGSPAILGVRPNVVGVGPAGAPRTIPVELYAHEPMSKYAIATLRLGEALIKAKTSGPPPAQIGAATGLILPEAGFVLFDAASGTALASDDGFALEPGAEPRM